MFPLSVVVVFYGIFLKFSPQQVLQTPMALGVIAKEATQ
jgi:hypothetical protein